jgi:hypothetical protein
LDLDRFPEAAVLLAALQPERSAPGWERHLQRVADSGGLLLGIVEGTRLQAVMAVERSHYAWHEDWLAVSRITGLAGAPGPQAGRRLKLLLTAAETWSRKASCVAMLTEPAPWAAGSGFVPQVGIPYWQVSPEQLRRYRQAQPMRPITAEDQPALQALFQRRALELGGSLQRDPDAWSALFNDLTPAGPLHGFMTASGSAYVVLHGGHASANDITVPVLEWADDGPAGFASVTTFLAQLQGRIRQLTLPVPPDRPVATLLATAAPLQAQLWFGPGLRVIDPTPVLQQALPNVGIDTHEGYSTLHLPEGTMMLPDRTLSALVGGSIDAQAACHLGDVTGEPSACQTFVQRWPASSRFRFPPPGRRYP